MKAWMGKLLALIVISASVSIIFGTVALADQEGDFAYIVADGQATLTHYTGSDSVVTVPDELGGCPVTIIGRGAFFSNTIITSVHLPDSITSIEYSAFSDCQKLNTVNFPTSLETIGDYAFDNCKITAIDLPQCIQSIGKYAFSGDRMTSIDLPDSISQLDEGIFCQCHFLESVKLPANINTINAMLFSGCEKLQNITLPENITSIGQNAFMGCSNLTSIQIPDKVTEIGWNAFSECTYLKDINLPSGLNNISPNLFRDCTALKSIDIPENAAYIGTGAFFDTGLVSINIPDGVSSIGDSAFQDCSNLTTINIHYNSLRLYRYVFSTCKNLENVYFYGPLPTFGDNDFSNDGANLKLYYHISMSSSWDGFTLYPVQPYCDLVLDLNYNDLRSTIHAPLNDGRIALPDMPVRDGYDFEGWFQDQNCQTTWNFSNIVSEDMTLYASWGIGFFTVDFNSFGGTQVNSIQVNSIQTIQRPDDPSKTGYTFIGWYKDSSLTIAWNFDVDTVQGYTMLYAKWNPVLVTVHFDTQNDQSSIDDIKVEYGSTINECPNPTWYGHVFTGWFKEKECNNKWSFDSDPNPDIVYLEITLYAGWTTKEFTVTFNPENDQSTFSIQANYGSKITAPADPALLGYVFRGWFKDSQCTQLWNFDTDTVPGDITLYAGWSSSPTVIQASPLNYNTIQVTWSAVPNTTKYELYRSAVDQSHFKLLTTTASTSYKNTSVNTGTTYYYRVRAYRLVNGKKVYGDYSGFANATTSLGAPATVSAASASWNSVKITWGSVDGKSGYEIYRCATEDGAYTKIGSTSSTTYTDSKGLTTGTPYYYKVIAYRTVSGKKVYSVYSSPASATPVPGTPKAKAARASSSSIKVSWGSIAGATGYEVEVLVNGNFQLLMDTTKTSFTNTGLTKGTTYTYRVRAYRTVNGNKVYSGYSAEVSAKP